MTKEKVWILSILVATMMARHLASPFTRAAVRSRPVTHESFIADVRTHTFGFHYPTFARRQRPLSSLSMAAQLQEGDSVRIAVNGDTMQGVVKEVRGSGWYSVQVSSSEGPTFVKVRKKQVLSTRDPDRVSEKSIQNNNNNKRVLTPTVLEQQVSEDTQTAFTKDESPLVPPPTVVDLDAALASMDSTDPVRNERDLLYLEQCAHHASIKEWVAFTDLHCSPSSMDTCLQILKRVHQEALQRNAGVLFLGDWWHHRATIRVDMLNAVLEALSDWKVPMILIPGNHDQVTLGGHLHALTPLQNAFRVRDGSLPGPLVFTHPTKFGQALFVPHIRDVTVMESVLHSEAALQCKALFCHADVTGAYMNDLIVSQGGVSPSAFPPNIPIYSGHFHKPHTVTRGNVSIEYIGSPYETSLAEARQLKALVVVDATNNWSVVERIPLNIGRKHYSVSSIEEFMTLCPESEIMSPDHGVVRSGDRVVVTVSKQDLENARRSVPSGEVCPFDAQVKALRRAGAIVEVRETKAQALAPLQGGADVALEEMTRQTTLTCFLTEQVQRESMTNETAKELLKVGLELLEELEASDDETPRGGGNNATDLVFESVTLQGFGPFKDQVTYPLLNRGLVLLRGTNMDGGGDSNGSGKSSLAMATLWALTGGLDPRPSQDAKVADVVNDECKSARVSVRGTLNGKPFIITRTKTSTKGALAFHLDGKDLTTQSIKETQAVLDESLGVGPQILARTMFHGQHSMNGLLEATDAKLKEELSLIVPLSLWQQGATLARARSREATKKAAEYQGMITLRTSDVEDLIQRRDAANATATARQAEFMELQGRVKGEIQELLRESDEEHGVNVQDLQESLQRSSVEIQELETQLETIVQKRESEVFQLQTRHDEVSVHVAAMRDKLQSAQQVHERAQLKRESLQSNLEQIEKKWNLSISPDGISGDVAPPQVCPTCQQPISSKGEGHSHDDLQRIMTNEVEDIVQRLVAADAAVKEASHIQAVAESEYAAEEKNFEESMRTLEEARAAWVESVKSVEEDLAESRSHQAALSAQLSSVAKSMQQEALVKAKEATLFDEQKAVQASLRVFEDLSKTVEETEHRLQELRASNEEKRSLSVTMTNLADAFGQRGVQTFVLQNAVDALQSTSQLYLDELSDGTQKLELSLDAGDRISRKAFLRGPDGGFAERPLASLSGGQWRRCSLALSLGFADLAARRGRMTTSLCVLDEPLTHLDRSGRSRVGNVLRNLLRHDETRSNGMSVSTIVMILQDLAAEELEESFDHIDEVTKTSGLSLVKIDEQS